MAERNPFRDAAAAAQIESGRRGSVTGLLDWAGDRGVLGGASDAIWGKSVARQQLEASQAEQQAERQRTDLASQREKESVLELYKLAEGARTSLRDLGNPRPTTADVMRALVTNPKFGAAAIGLPANRIGPVIQEILGATQQPAPAKPVNVPEGSVLVNPETGAPVFANPKPVENLRNKAEVGEVAKRAVGQLDKVVEAGNQARMDELALSELERLGDKIGTGGAAAIRGYFSRIGVDLGDASDINAFESLVDRLTPAQRSGLPGSASDADVRMFRSALPSLIRQPEGNKLIVGTLKAMNADRIKRAEIAESVFTGDRTVPEALRAMRSLPNPLRRFQESDIGKQLLKGASANLRNPIASATPTPMPKVFDYDPETGVFAEGK